MYYLRNDINQCNIYECKKHIRDKMEQNRNQNPDNFFARDRDILKKYVTRPVEGPDFKRTDNEEHSSVQGLHELRFRLVIYCI